MARENEAGESRAEVKAKRDVQFWLDVVMKLTVPLGAIVAAWLANHFEQNRANLQLINQREQAESSLRATMFGQLITPIAGPGDSGAETDPVRYAVLAQLLTLNFHEHFELKPLLQDADDRLVQVQGNRRTGGRRAGAQQSARGGPSGHPAPDRAALGRRGRRSARRPRRMETTFQFVSDPDLEDSFSQAANSATRAGAQQAAQVLHRQFAGLPRHAFRRVRQTGLLRRTRACADLAGYTHRDRSRTIDSISP